MITYFYVLCYMLFSECFAEIIIGISYIITYIFSLNRSFINLGFRPFNVLA